jgi:hypothetical protein
MNLEYTETGRVSCRSTKSVLALIEVIILAHHHIYPLGEVIDGPFNGFRELKEFSEKTYYRGY